MPKKFHPQPDSQSGARKKPKTFHHSRQKSSQHTPRGAMSCLGKIVSSPLHPSMVTECVANIIFRHTIISSGADFIEKRHNTQYTGDRDKRMAELKNEKDKLNHLAGKSRFFVTLFEPPKHPTFNEDSLYLTYNREIDLFEATKPRSQLKPLLVDQRNDINNQLAQALQYLFDHDIVHGDLKPENILVKIENKSVMLRICDFGNARYRRELGDPFYGGTISYRAPEVLLTSILHFASDIWSLALIFFYLDNQRKDLFYFEDQEKEVERFIGFTENPSVFKEHLEEKSLSKFAKKMLHLNPEKRATHQEVAQHFSSRPTA